MRAIAAALTIMLSVSLGVMCLQAQTSSEQPSPTNPAPSPQPPPAPAVTPPEPSQQPPPAPAATPPAPVAAPAPAPPAGPKARDLQGLDVFGSDGKLIGRVLKATELSGGVAGDLEVHSQGFFGYFASVYVVPANKAALKNGRVELSVNSEQAKQWKR